MIEFDPTQKKLLYWSKFPPVKYTSQPYTSIYKFTYIAFTDLKKKVTFICPF